MCVCPFMCIVVYVFGAIVLCMVMCAYVYVYACLCISDYVCFRGWSMHTHFIVFVSLRFLSVISASVFDMGIGVVLGLGMCLCWC